MTAHNLVIVESPAKAKTINKYLGSDYQVIASYGHVRDLPPKDGSVQPDNGFAMAWEMNERAKKQVNEILKLAKASDTVYLATDPDREGEAISWHIAEIFRDKKIKASLKRVAFNEITKKAVQDAFAHARDIDNHLVEAYLARRALDYLVGFTLSPILWRKLPGSRSAGRVQSVALRLVCEREGEIEAFREEEYWSIEALLKTGGNETFTAKLTQVDGKKLQKMDIHNKDEAGALAKRLEACKDALTVTDVEKKQVRRNPPPPFITSTLQQEASRKLGFSATKTMRTAQKLYEGITLGGETVGLITYMRTDGVTLSGEAMNSIRDLIGKNFGANYVPGQPRFYKSKAKNAQEAHEAIRPTDAFRKPEDVAAFLNDDENKLYTLIWKRTVACQMENAVLDQTKADISNDKGDLVLRATGSSIAFDGYYVLYMEGRDDDAESEDDDKRLPVLNAKDRLSAKEVLPNQHFTQPPPRYTEATLVKRMEELGIGRPSTYASILQVLQDRNYVRLDKKRFFSENRGRVVTTFLTNFFGKYVEYDFTANLEDQLDHISAGDLEWQQVLGDFWREFSATVEETKELRITDVINALDAELEHMLFPPSEDGSDPRKCPSCADGRLGLKLGKFGGFIGCSNYPECKHTRPFMAAEEGGEDDGVLDGGQPKDLGLHPDTGMPVTLRRGPYGYYVQLEPLPVEELPEPPVEEPALDSKGKPKKVKKPKKPKVPKPKRMAIPRGFALDQVDLNQAVKLLTLPRDVGLHPETGEMIKAGIGRFGPYLVHQGKFKSLPKDEPDAVLTIGLNRAVDILAQESARGGFGELRKIGDHPEDGTPVSINRGRFGPYIKHGKMNASLPKDAEINDVTMEQALDLLAKKAEKDKASGKSGTKTKAKKPAKSAKSAKKK